MAVAWEWEYCDEPEVSNFSFELLLPSHVFIVMMGGHTVDTSSAAFVHSKLLLVSMKLSCQFLDPLLEMLPARLRYHEAFTSLRKLLRLRTS